MSNLESQVKTLPRSPGVYFFKNSKGEVLYIGKGNNLKNRVSSYFKDELSRGPGIEQMLLKATEVEERVCDSEIEALLLEAKLIKEYQPKYNARLKDDKSFNVIRISREEEYPRLLLVRQKNLAYEKEKHKKSRFFGPYTSAGQLRQALKILRRIFPFCNLTPNEKKRALKLNRPCLYYSLNLCPGVCVNKVPVLEYRQIIKGLIDFLEGRKIKVIKETKKEMKAAAQKKEFEKAAKLRDRLFALEHLTQFSRLRFFEGILIGVEKSTKVPHRVEAYDVSNIFGQYTVGALVTFLHGQKDGDSYRKFKINPPAGGAAGGEGINDAAALAEVLRRRLAHLEWPYPDLIMVDGGKAQLNAAQKVLFNKGLKIPLLAVAKGPSRKKAEQFWHGPKILKDEKKIRQIMAEAHRFAIRYYRLLHRKGLREK